MNYIWMWHRFIIFILSSTTSIRNAIKLIRGAVKWKQRNCDANALHTKRFHEIYRLRHLLTFIPARMTATMWRCSYMRQICMTSCMNSMMYVFSNHNFGRISPSQFRTIFPNHFRFDWIAIGRRTRERSEKVAIVISNVVQRMENVAMCVHTVGTVLRHHQCRIITIDPFTTHFSIQYSMSSQIIPLNCGQSLTAWEGSNPKNESAIE